MAKEIQKGKFVQDAAQQFESLAEEIEGRHRSRCVNAWVKEELVPRLKKWEDADPALYAASVGTSGPFRSSSPAVVTIGNYTYALPAGVKAPKLPYDLTTEEEVYQKYADAEALDDISKAKLLTNKAERLRELLGEFLKDFVSYEQLIFSLPEAKSFSPTKCASQKRPRVVKVPTQELRGLMMEAVRLKEARG